MEPVTAMVPVGNAGFGSSYKTLMSLSRIYPSSGAKVVVAEADAVCCDVTGTGAATGAAVGAGTGAGVILLEEQRKNHVNVCMRERLHKKKQKRGSQASVVLTLMVDPHPGW